MNHRFYEYKKIVEARIAEANTICESTNQRKVPNNFSESVIIERIMRLGIEARAFEPQGYKELRELAVLTIRDHAARQSVAYVAREALKPVEIRYTSPI